MVYFTLFMNNEFVLLRLSCRVQACLNLYRIIFNVIFRPFPMFWDYQQYIPGYFAMIYQYE